MERAKVKKNSQSITKRWMINSLLLTVGILVCAGIATLFVTRNYYYSSVEQSINLRISGMKSTIDSISTSAEDVTEMEIRKLVENFSEKSLFEFMLFDTSGRVVATSSGFEPDNQSPNDDYWAAINSGVGSGKYIGENAFGERVMAMTYLLPKPVNSISAVRFVTSMEGVNSKLSELVWIVFMIIIVILFFSIITGTYFVRSIVGPIDKLNQSTKQIASGDFSVRVAHDRDDEIGELCGNVNDMARALAYGEKLKNDFISSVSHELRTPLTSIKGWAETLSALDNEDAEYRKRGLSIIVREADRLSVMVEELLDFSRAQADSFKLELEKIDIVAEISEAVMIFTEYAKKEGIELEYTEYENPIPIMGDKNRLRQVFGNIIDNSIKYTNKGGHVKISTETDDTNVKIIIADNGCGIAPEDIPLVKTKFYKANKSKRGSGIGLAVADNFINGHGGSMSIESELNKGTTITILLPLYNGKEIK